MGKKPMPIRPPRTFEQLSAAIIQAMPMSDELAQLSEEQIQQLRQYGNGLDNLLYIASEKGKKLLEEIRRSKKNVPSPQPETQE